MNVRSIQHFAEQLIPLLATPWGVLGMIGFVVMLTVIVNSGPSKQ